MLPRMGCYIQRAFSEIPSPISLAQFRAWVWSPRQQSRLLPHRIGGTVCSCSVSVLCTNPLGHRAGMLHLKIHVPTRVSGPVNGNLCQPMQSNVGRLCCLTCSKPPSRGSRLTYSLMLSTYYVPTVWKLLKMTALRS